ncbi:DUF4910 domain-containing protein [Helicobacter winghamensis]|uniref:DUF4910 domain-containing protein n=1 Tax=Helicobacter winghamensis TaxID=157268 RepID=UPI0027A33465
MDSLNQAFQNAFKQYATNCAIEVDKESITYAELETQANALAIFLTQNCVQENSIILFGTRSIEVYVSVVACVLGNFTYVPLNPRFPNERLQTMIARTESTTMLLCKECVKSFCKIANSIKSLNILCFKVDFTELKKQFPQHNFVEIPLEFPQKTNFTISKSTTQNPAYLLFTSGSTGIPKGVLVSRNNLISYVNRIQNLYHFTPQDRISQFFDLTFDLSMHDIFCTLLSGATLVVIPQIWLLNPLKFIVTKQLSVLFAPPSLIAYLQNLKALKENVLPNLKIALFCGEALPVKSAIAFAKAAPNALLDNLYGPTEATISFTHYRFIQKGGIQNAIPPLQEDILPLGLPFDGLMLSLRNTQNKEVKTGDAGEILLGSKVKETSQIALGYYNDPSKTQEKFIEEKGIRWYKTGDLGRFNTTLNAYCFLGRLDEQVKIQGFRVELLEIDNALSLASNKQGRAIVLQENDFNVLYGVIEDKQKDSTEILNTLRQKLPHYMLPKQIFYLESFPLNANGKVDRNAIKQWLIHQITPPPPHTRQIDSLLNYGQEMYALAQTLFKIPRSLSGKGNRQTLQILKDSLKTADLNIYAIPTGTQAFDWEIPKEWNVKDAYILTPSGEKICDFHANNLHLVGYSIPTRAELTFRELKEHLHFLENQPKAIPYITSYYKEYFGFCLSFEAFKALQNSYENSQEKFQIVIDSTLENGTMNYGEIKIKGQSKQEILLSTYICHPQMANNELSGILLCHSLAKILSQRENRYSYRILLLPETLGSIYYLSQHLKELKESCIAGFVLTCIGDGGEYSVLHSKSANNLADRAAQHILKHYYKNHKAYSYLERGSDERQYCAPGIDLPFCTLMRTKFGEYKEYHTSLDDLSLLSPKSLANSLEYVLRVLEVVEMNGVYANMILCEPKLSKYDLYPTLSTKDTFAKIKDMRNLLMYCDGKLDLLEIAEICDFNLLELKEYLQKFITKGLLKNVKE